MISKNLYVFSFLLLLLFSWRKTQLLTPQFTVENEEKNFVNITMQKMPTQVENKHLLVHIIPHTLHLFHPSTDNGRVQAIANAYQSAFCRADITFTDSKHLRNIVPHFENKRQNYKSIVEISFK